MKYITLVFTILISLQSYCQKDKGTITLNNGKILSGLLKVTATSFKFKENENSETIKYDYNTATSAIVINSKNEALKYGYVYVDYQEKPLLLTVINDGFLKLYAEYISSYNGMGFRSTSTFHIKRTTDKIGQYFVAYGYIPKIGFKKVVESYFSDCPQIQEKVENGEFKKGDFENIVNFYNQHCASK
ncbi:hypothetical protein [Flavobacterium sp. 3HN19-14]|uniref:hypothetical protein n=1 Tax=Flavobacterium sp. 3HN19-14 TaxID=3448133 RepID=UPI003EDFED0F